MATQTEWTADYVMEFGVIGNVAQDIADAHKAALAAEREKHRPSEIAGIKVRWPYDEEMQQLREQLAAEREKVRTAEAEQKATEAGYDMIAADNRTLVDALKEVSKIGETDNDAVEAADRMHKVAIAALAKVKQ